MYGWKLFSPRQAPTPAQEPLIRFIAATAQLLNNDNLYQLFVLLLGEKYMTKTVYRTEGLAWLTAGSSWLERWQQEFEAASHLLSPRAVGAAGQ